MARNRLEFGGLVHDTIKFCRSWPLHCSAYFALLSIGEKMGVNGEEMVLFIIGCADSSCRGDAAIEGVRQKDRCGGGRANWLVNRRRLRDRSGSRPGVLRDRRGTHRSGSTYDSGFMYSETLEKEHKIGRWGL